MNSSGTTAMNSSGTSFSQLSLTPPWNTSGSNIWNSESWMARNVRHDPYSIPSSENSIPILLHNYHHRLVERTAKLYHTIRGWDEDGPAKNVANFVRNRKRVPGLGRDSFIATKIGPTRSRRDVTNDNITTASNSDGNETNPNPKQSSNLHWIILYSLVSVLVTMANIITILVILSCRKLCNSTNYYVLSLSCAYLLTGLVTLPDYVILYFFNPSATLSCQLGIYLNFLNTVAGLSSVYSIMGIAMDRYYAVMKPFSRRLTQIYVWPIITTIWSASIITSAPIIFILKRRIRAANLINSETWDENVHNSSLKGKMDYTSADNKEYIRRLYADVLRFVNSQTANSPSINGTLKDASLFNSSTLLHALFGSSYPHNIKNMSKAHFTSLIRGFLDNFTTNATITTATTTLNTREIATMLKNATTPAVINNLLNDTTTPPGNDYNPCLLTIQESKILLYFQVSVGCALPLLITTLLYVNMACRLWKTTGNYGTTSTNAPPTVVAATASSPGASKARNHRIHSTMLSGRRFMPRDSYVFGRASGTEHHDVGSRLGTIETFNQEDRPSVKRHTKFASLKRFCCRSSGSVVNERKASTDRSAHPSIAGDKPPNKSMTRPKSNGDDKGHNDRKGTMNRFPDILEADENENQRFLLQVSPIPHRSNSPETGDLSSDVTTETTRLTMGSPYSDQGHFFDVTNNSTPVATQYLEKPSNHNADPSSVSLNSPKVVRFQPSAIQQQSSEIDEQQNILPDALEPEARDLIAQLRQNPSNGLLPNKRSDDALTSSHNRRRRSTTFLHKRFLPTSSARESGSKDFVKPKNLSHLSLRRVGGKARRGLSVMVKSNDGQGSAPGSGLGLMSTAESHRNSRNKQAAKMVLTLVFLYSACNLPFYVFSALNIHGVHMDNISIHIHNLLIHTDHWLHIAIYLFFNANFRTAFYKRFIQCSWPHFSMGKVANFCGSIFHNCCGVSHQLCPLSRRHQSSDSIRQSGQRSTKAKIGRAKSHKWEEERSNYFSVVD